MSRSNDGALREPSSERPASSDRALRLIALFKFGKTILLVLMAAGALSLVRPVVAAYAEQAVTALGASGNHRLLPRILARVLGLPSPRLEELGVGALFYASLFLVEGIGLWRGLRWAEYLTVIATGSLVPLELWELSRRFTAVRVLALVLNLVIVGYLILRLHESHTSSRVAAA